MTHITRNVTGGAGKTVLIAAITATVPTDAGQIQVQSAVGWPTSNFVIVIDRNKATMEKILVSSRSETILTVAASGRGYDGTTAQAHTAGAAVEHIIDALALTAILEHVNTDSAHDHTGYVLSANVGAGGDLASESLGAAAALGATGKYADAAHRHPWPAIPAFRLSQQSAAQSFTSGTSAAVQFDTEALDTHNGHDNVTNNSRYTIPTGWDGVWAFVASVEFAASATGYRELYLRLGGATAYGQTREMALAVPTSIVTCSIELVGLIGGSYLEVVATQNSGGNLAIPGSDQFTRFEGWWVRP